MHSDILELAPTLISTVKAVEQGCRTIQADPHFIWDSSEDEMKRCGPECRGSLAVCTLLQLTNKTTRDITDKLEDSHDPDYEQYIDPVYRAFAYGIEIDKNDADFSDLAYFEKALYQLQSHELLPLLEFYHLEKHPNANVARQWLLDNPTITFDEGTTKPDLIRYANFLKDTLLPLLEKWFATVRVDKGFRSDN